MAKRGVSRATKATMPKVVEVKKINAATAAKTAIENAKKQTGKKN